MASATPEPVDMPVHEMLRNLVTGGSATLGAPALSTSPRQRSGPLTVECANSEPSNRSAAGPSIEVAIKPSSATDGDTPGAIGLLVNAARAVTLWNVHAVRAGGARVVAGRHLALVPGTAERELYHELALRTPDWPPAAAPNAWALAASLRHRKIFPPANGDAASNVAGVRGIHGRLSLLMHRERAAETGGGLWDFEAAVRGGTLGRGVAACALVRCSGMQEWPTTVIRGIPAIARLRAYVYAMPAHTAMLPAADAPRHHVGCLRGSETLVLAPGGAACAAVSGETDVALRGGRARLRCYAAAGVAVPTLNRDGLDNIDAALSVGWAIVPPPRRQKGRLANSAPAQQLECAFPLKAWLHPQPSARRLHQALNFRCRVVWEPADPEDVVPS